MNTQNLNTKRKKTLWDEIGLPSGEIALHTAIIKGFSYDVFVRLSSLIGIDKNKLAASISISQSTLYRRATAEKFTQCESDKLYRFIEVISVVINYFEGNPQVALSWLQSNVKGLNGNRPIDLLDNSAGCRAVVDMIMRLQHGIFM